MEKWLKCEIIKGMFSDEVTVRVRGESGQSVAVFVPTSQIEPNQKFVRVRAFEKQGKFLAVLPDERHTSVAVRHQDLQPA